MCYTNGDKKYFQSPISTIAHAPIDIELIERADSSGNTIWKNSVGIPANFAKTASSCANAGILNTQTLPLALKQLSQPRAASRVYVGNLNSETSAVCTSQQYLWIIFSTARFINKNDLEDKVNCVEFLCDEGLFNTEKLCSECNSPMNLKKTSGQKNCHILCVQDGTKE